MDSIPVPATRFRIFAILKKNLSEVAGQKNLSLFFKKKRKLGLFTNGHEPIGFTPEP